MARATAACPNCGAQIEFIWSGAVQTTCPACRSILVRHDLDLEKVGEVGDVPRTVSPIKIGTEGRYKGTPFTVVGRIVYEYQRGHWNEWHIRLADETSAWLSDAQAEYAVTRLVAADDPLPGLHGAQVGQRFRFDDTEYRVASVTRANYAGVEGELPFEYWDKSEIVLVDLVSSTDRFGTIDYSEKSPLLFLGEYETFDELQLSNLREAWEEEQDAQVAGARGLNCPSCGAAFELLAGGLSVNVACPACASILNATDPNLRVLQTYEKRAQRWKPKIPLGTMGKLKGEEWQVIGFQVRGITVDGVKYDWDEYLLWSRQRGFRYLSEYQGHWNDISVVKSRPKDVSGGPQPVVEYLGRSYKHFQSAEATTRFILGEFPWEVRVGDTATSEDYVSPPLMLSRERTADEETWSLGSYTSPERIKEAFGLKSLPSPVGVFSNQPNPRTGTAGSYLRVFGVLLLLLFAVTCARFATASREKVFAQNYRFDPRTADTTAFVTPIFELKGRTSNVEVVIETSLQNASAFFNLALINADDGTAFDFGREVSEFRGVEDGESWHEGSPNDKSLIPSIPPGRYYLRVDPEGDAGTGALGDKGTPPFSYTIRLRRDVPRLWIYMVTIVLLGLPVIGAVISEHSFESRRWAESDHAPVTTSDDEEEE